MQKTFDIKAEPRTELDAWERWLNFQQTRLLTIKPQRRATVKNDDWNTRFDENFVCVVVNGRCNHADKYTYYVDKDGEEYEYQPPEYVWSDEVIRCNRCDAMQIVETGEWLYE